MAGEVVTGGLGGLMTGAGYGSQFGPIGTGIGAGIGLFAGLAGGAQAKKLDKAYQAAEKNINPVDPMLTGLMSRYRQQERNYRAGTDTSSAFAAGQARNVAAQTQVNLQRAGGPGLVGNLLRSQQAMGGTIAGIGAQAAQGADRMLGAQAGIIGNISERVYQRQRELRNQAMERSAGARQGLNNLLAGGLAMLPQFGASFAKRAPGGVGNVFDPFASSSKGMGTNFPGAIDTADMARPTYMPPRNFSTPLSYQPIGG